MVTVGLNYTFASIFTLEAFLKITAMGKDYFKESWNKFDLGIVVGTGFGITL
jgi:hypothetical protein